MGTDLYKFPHFRNVYIHVKHMKIARPSVHQYDCMHAAAKGTQDRFS